MAMLTFLVTIAVLIASIYAGHRFNMYLYARGAVGGHARGMASVEEESYTVSNSNEASLIQVRDYGLQYARTGILIFAAIALLLVMGIVILIISVL
ncbi:MAG TPA: hypothetical protein VGM01_11535 [Ktedonobacteraceae bacterium]|jgi:hypothetical protein